MINSNTAPTVPDPHAANGRLNGKLLPMPEISSEHADANRKLIASYKAYRYLQRRLSDCCSCD